MENGGYYAIKGFSYQYIVSLIEVLKCNDENKIFSFEQLQDFNDNENIFQMKYKETQHFTNSKIKEPVIKIFLEYLETKKDYILYVYFPDKINETMEFKSINELDNVLLNCKINNKEYSFTQKQKEEFIKHFKVIFSKDYIEKSCELNDLIANNLNVTKDIAEMYAYSLSAYIINIIVSNQPQNRNLLFDFSYYNKKINGDNKIPLLVVFEEAHKYVPKSDLSKYKSSKLSIERIAKEGRKYGITLAIVSQRPSEISETIFSQCNTFIAMRLTNPDDQNYVKKLLPDTLGNLTGKLNSLSAGEALLIGESVIMPSLVKIDRCNPEPSSNDIMYLDIWKENWYEEDFNNIILQWEK